MKRPPAAQARAVSQVAFFPPELAGGLESSQLGSLDGKMDAVPQTDNLRSLYFKRNQSTDLDERSDKELVRLVIEHAKGVVSHPSRPMRTIVGEWSQYPHGDLALEETLEENPTLSPFESFLVEVNEERPFSCVAMLDASSSMSGEKHLLSSVAVAVLFLKAAPRLTSLVLFSSKPKTLKAWGVEESVESTLLRFLRYHPRGFTNITGGLGEGLRQLGPSGRKVGILATDGRATEGGDPTELAKQYDFLVVLHLHGPGSHLETSRQIASAGHGVCLEVETFDQLPQRLYDALRMLTRL